MASQLAQLQEDRAQYQEQLDLVADSLRDDPENEELLALKEELASAISIIDDSIAELKPSKHAAKAPTPGTSAPPPSSSKDGPEAAGPTTVAYKVNDSILARWVSGDKAYYPARIMSITGSATAPMYTVKFKSYNAIETLRAHEIRPLSGNSGGSGGNNSGTKRKAETATTTPDTPNTPITPTTASATRSPPPPPPSHAHAAPPPPPAQLYAGSGAPPPPPPPTSSVPPAAVVAAAAPPPPPPPTTTTTTTAPPFFGRRTIDRFNAGIVSSAAAQLYPQAALIQGPHHGGSGSSAAAAAASAGAQAAGAASTASTAAADEPPPKKFKKIKATKQLEAGKSKWQDFNKSKFGKGGSSSSKKDSMFRTPEGINGRVGFVGAGKTSRKDPARSRHIYQTNDDLD